MNYRVCVVLIVAVGLSIGSRANSVELRFAPQPSRTVESRQTTSLVQRVDLKGDEELIARNRARGIIFPNTIKTESMFVTRQRSGPAGPDGSFSIHMDYIDATSRSVDQIGMPVPIGAAGANLIGLVVEGRVDSNGVVQYISHSGGNSDALSRTELAGLLANLFSAMEKLDGIKFDLGQSAVQDFRLDIPLAGFDPVQVNMENTYKLIEVVGDDARFSVQTRFKIGNFPEGVKVQVAGTGFGAMIYNRSLLTMTSASTVMQLTLDVKGPGLVLKSEMNGRVTSAAKVTLE